jgi:hypothetical protein
MTSTETDSAIFGGPLTYEQFRKLFPATRNFQAYDHDERAMHAASHRTGYLKRQAVGEHFYTHQLLLNVCFPTAQGATRRAYEIYLSQFAEAAENPTGIKGDENMNKEERRDLHEESTQLAYQAIKFSPLFRLLTNDQADALAEELANKVDVRLAVLIDEELDRIEAKAEAA